VPRAPKRTVTTAAIQSGSYRLRSVGIAVIAFSACLSSPIQRSLIMSRRPENSGCGLDDAGAKVMRNAHQWMPCSLHSWISSTSGFGIPRNVAALFSPLTIG
jgi:hypothetical protein